MENTTTTDHTRRQARENVSFHKNAIATAAPPFLAEAFGTRIASATPAPPDWKSIFASASLTGKAFHGKLMIPREHLMSNHLQAGDIGVIFAARGAGKTLFTMMLAHALATGGAFGVWRPRPVGEVHPVLYVDGEMMEEDSQERSQEMGIDSEDFHWLHSDHIGARTSSALDLSRTEQQQAVLGLCRDKMIEVLVLDNRSCLFTGIEENSNDHWRDMACPWLRELRRNKIAVVLIDHAGKSGTLRGASQREDLLDWTIEITPLEGDGPRQKALSVGYTKFRRKHQPLSSKWVFEKIGGKLAVRAEFFEGKDRMLFEIGQGITTNKDLAQQLRVEPGTITKWGARLAAEGKVTKTAKGGYKLLGDGPLA